MLVDVSQLPKAPELLVSPVPPGFHFTNDFLDMLRDAGELRLHGLAGLPPTFIAVAELDVFRDEDMAYAIGLTAEGVPVGPHPYPGAIKPRIRSRPTPASPRAPRERDTAISLAIRMDEAGARLTLINKADPQVGPAAKNLASKQVRHNRMMRRAAAKD